MAIPEHVEKLKEGVEAWNSWRAIHPDVSPDLSGLNLRNRDEFGASEIWFEKSYNPSGRDLSSVDMSGINLRGSNLRKIDLYRAKLSDADLSESDLRAAKLRRMDAKRLWLWNSDLRGADISYSNISSGMLSQSNLTGTKLIRADVSNVGVHKVKYKRERMRGTCLGIIGASTVNGDAVFRRDLIDQDYIDNKAEKWTRPVWNPARFLLLWPWSAIDFGRSINRVLFFAFIIVVAFGSAYPVLEAGGHIAYLNDAGVDNWLRPFYIAAISFSTLGFTDVVVAESWYGQIALMANVLLGYFTLGLVLSILANSVARRG